MATLGERLEMLLEEKGLERKQLAEIINLSPSTISGYITNYRTPSDEVKNKLADFFDVSVDFLIGRTDQRKPSEKGPIVKAYHNLDASGLSEEDIEKVEEYIRLLKLKYNPDGSLKK